MTLIGKTREEVVQYLRSAVGPVTLTVLPKPNQCRTVAETDSGAGDSFFVRAHFSMEVTKKGELAVHEGDVFAVMDTLPDGNPGYWRARKVDSGRSLASSEDAGIGIGSMGLIPSRSKADQIVIKQNLAQGKPGPNERGGAFFRSFRRSKSATRGGGTRDGGDEDDNKRLSAGLDVISYERVVQKISDCRRPVVVLGLFCDTVRTMLIRDHPDRFASPNDEVETPKDPVPVNVRPILSVGPLQHCILILSPPAIEYLLQRTDLNPITVYISPVSKAVVKAVKLKLAPNYNKNPGFMYEEAARFEKNYAHLFTATVPYSADDAWFFNLKEAIDRLQNQPTWVGVSQAELDAAAATEAAKILPPIKTAATSAATTRTGRAPTAASRVSRTTDDLPQEYKTQETGDGRGGGAVTQTAAVTAAAPAAAGRLYTKNEAPSATGSVAKMAAAKTRMQSTSSSLDQSSDRNNHYASQGARPRNAVPATPSHETML
jgi:hypothetical protein